MGLEFERPVGAHADVMELEYIAALHQTDDTDHEGWLNASIEACDVKHYLLSRHGIVATEEVIRNLIFSGLAGGDGADDLIDIPEMVAILIIPFLSKITASADEGPSDLNPADMLEFEKKALEKSRSASINMRKESNRIIPDVLDIILNDTTGSSEPRPLTKELLYAIFARYEEIELLQNDDNLVDDMIKLAAGEGGDVMLNSETFARVLTNDIKLYKADNEYRISTHYEDAFDISHGDRESAESEEKNFKRVFTFPQIDFLADTFRSKLQFSCALMVFIFTYTAYFNPFTSDYIQVCAVERRDNYECQVGLSIVTWIVVMATVMGVGTPTVLILNLGNDPHHASLLEKIGGLVGTLVIILLPIFWKFNAHFFVTETQEDEDTAKVVTAMTIILLIFGIILLLLQISSIVGEFTNRESKFLSLLRGSAAKNDAGIKVAASFKVAKLVMNAYDLHKEGVGNRSMIASRISGNDSTTSSNARALLNFTKQSDMTETSGGFVWSWKQFISGSLVFKEGIWVHTRMLAANFSQVLVILITVIVGILSLEAAVKSLGQTSTVYSTFPEDLDSSCTPIFDFDECTFPEYDSTSPGFAICPLFYSNTCQFVAVDDDLKEAYCEYFDSSTEALSKYGIVTCPDLVYPYPNSVYSYTKGTNETNYCGGALSACSPLSNSTDGTYALCLIGINNVFSPFSFTGNSCESIPQIQKLMKDNPVGAEEIASWIPKPWMFRSSFGVGIASAVLAGIFNAAVNVPSIITSTLKFRAGVLPSLRDENFKLYRIHMLKTTSLIGSSLWGAFFTSILMIILISTPLFFSFWHVTRPYVLRSLSLLLGVIVTLGFKIIVEAKLSSYSYAAFYRKRPVLCNIVNVALECWHLALTVGFIAARAVKLLLITSLFIGRIDQPFLAKGIGMLGPINLDILPSIFRKDLLSTDAHRHPYIERLGLMYMMKLRHGDNFGNRAGSIWRLLFVFALMPWLRKYRISSDEDILENDIELKLGKKFVREKKHIKELEDENKTLRAKVAEYEANVGISV